MAEPFLGEIRMTSFDFAPSGWALCNGQILLISSNPALFSILGITYGGNGSTTFALPDLRSRVPIHRDGSHLLGSADGHETHVLSADETAHTHPLKASTADADSNDPAGRYPAYRDTEAYRAADNPVNLSGQALSSAGGGQAHNNLQPYLVINFIIATQGIFPSQ